MKKTERAKLLKKEGKTIQEIADILKISYSSAERYLRAFGTEKDVKDKVSVPTDVKKILTDDNHTIDAKIKALKLLNHSTESINEWLKELGDLTVNSQYADAKIRKPKKSKRYLVTSAQNNTPTNTKFWKKMLLFADHVDAEIICIPTRYRNPTAVEKSTKYTWDEQLEDYLYASDLKLHKRLLVKAGLKVGATSSTPNARVELMGDGASVIVGSPKIAMKSLPVLPESQNIFTLSTGSVSLPSMSDTVSGGIAEAHHSYGFVFVDIEDEDVVHTTNISAEENGNFTVFNIHVGDNGVSKTNVEALVWGDVHLAHKKESIIDIHKKLHKDFNIDIAVIHDMFDGESVSPHITDGIAKLQRKENGYNSLEDELNDMYKFLDWFEKNIKTTYIVRSNHDLFLDRKLQTGDVLSDTTNSLMLSKLLVFTLENIHKDFKGVIPELVNSTYRNINGLGIDDEVFVKDILISLHGHLGQSGSKGSPSQFKKLAYKTITGHTHSTSIESGCYTVGHTSKMKHGYNRGLSGWSWSSCLIHKTGKRQIFTINKKSKTFTTLFKI